MSGPKCDAIELRQREKQRRKEEYRKRLAARQEKIRAREQAERERARQEEERLASERERRRQEEEAVRRELQRGEDFNARAEEEYLALQRFQEEQEERRRREEFSGQQRFQEEQEADTRRREELSGQQRFQGEREADGRRHEEPSGLQKRFEEARCLYLAAAELAGKPAEVYTFAPETAGEQIERMERSARALQEQTVEKECRAQVNALIDKVISDMGYELMAEKISGREEETRAGLYRYKGNTAISVIESGGQFTMEVVALDSQDRLPRPDEAQALYETMGDFCRDYEKIREKLEETGQVVSTNIFHMPADKRLARVINRETYEVRRKKRKYDDEYMMTEQAKTAHREQR